MCHAHAHGVSPNVAVLVPDFLLIFFVFFCFLSLFCNASSPTPSFLVQNSERLRFCTRHFVPELLVSGVTVCHGVAHGGVSLQHTQETVRFWYRTECFTIVSLQHTGNGALLVPNKMFHDFVRFWYPTKCFTFCTRVPAICGTKRNVSRFTV